MRRKVRLKAMEMNGSANRNEQHFLSNIFFVKFSFGFQIKKKMKSDTVY